MTQYVLALVLKKDLEYPNSCFECVLNPPGTRGALNEYGGCRFRELCGDGVFDVKFVPTDSLHLVSLGTANKEIDRHENKPTD